jgi:hypothetical protein
VIEIDETELKRAEQHDVAGGLRGAARRFDGDGDGADSTVARSVAARFASSSFAGVTM